MLICFAYYYHGKQRAEVLNESYVRSVGLELTLDDFQKVSDAIPFLADLKPSGKYVMEDIHKVRLSQYRFAC